MNNTYDIVGEIVDSMRTGSGILSITDNSNGTYTVKVKQVANLYTSVLDLQDGDWITISDTPGFNDSFEVSNVNTSARTFKISKAAGQSITTLGTYKSNKPYYDFEKWLGEANKLTVQEISREYKTQKYPLFFLLLDSEEAYQGNENYYNAAFTLFIITSTASDKRANWRLANIFEPTLYPLMNVFIDKLKRNRYVRPANIDISKTDRFYLGTADANQNKLNQVVDAIEINFSGVGLFRGKDCANVRFPMPSTSDTILSTEDYNFLITENNYLIKT